MAYRHKPRFSKLLHGRENHCVSVSQRCLLFFYMFHTHRSQHADDCIRFQQCLQHAFPVLKASLNHGHIFSRPDRFCIRHVGGHLCAVKKRRVGHILPKQSPQTEYCNFHEILTLICVSFVSSADFLTHFPNVISYSNTPPVYDTMK